jgi:D-alanyl-D-alanine carboxypeptidase
MENNNNKSNAIKIIIAAIIFISLMVYILWGEYKLNLSTKKIEELKSQNQNYNEEVLKLKNLFTSSTEAFDDLYLTLSNVINEEGLKNKTLEEKVASLDRLTKSDPQLLKKYSKVYFLNENYRPAETQNVLSDYIFNKKQEYKLHVDVIYFLQNMIDDARKEGLDILVISAYRSFETQASMKSQKKIIYGVNTANRFVAEQGYSEHQLGTTVDFTTNKIAAASIKFELTPEYKWLQNNAHKYGFTISYPKGNSYYAYEPWHWRFVGKVLATQIYNDKINFYNLDQRYIDGYLIGMFDR